MKKTILTGMITAATMTFILSSCSKSDTPAPAVTTVEKNRFPESKFQFKCSVYIF